MKRKIMRSVVIALASFWSTQILADGGGQLQAPQAGACDSYIVAAVSAGNGSALNPVSPAVPSAERVDMIAQKNPDQCVTCCTRNQAACYKRKEDGGLCEVKHTKCVAHCSKQGKMPSDWFCWWQPQTTW